MTTLIIFSYFFVWYHEILLYEDMFNMNNDNFLVNGNDEKSPYMELQHRYSLSLATARPPGLCCQRLWLASKLTQPNTPSNERTIDEEARIACLSETHKHTQSARKIIIYGRTGAHEIPSGPTFTECFDIVINAGVM